MDKDHCLQVKLLTSTAKLPTKSYSSDAGIDIYSDEDVMIFPGETRKIKTGISICLPELANCNTHTMCSLIWDRSSLGSKGISHTAGVIDYSYRGEILVCLTNLNIRAVLDELFTNNDTRGIVCSTNSTGKHIFQRTMERHAYKISKGDKIAQILLQKVYKLDIVQVSELSDTQRGGKGFGSSGK